ncbi:hypothetical protein DPMN_048791 [Dreissena polymorpha]|uniref:Uncharacterized protein n=1 Tax=Dreissena polymorpha TaxID=45954 RepID=A0A9D4I2Q3_DREPO|nr:hypothetical protein DPMN_048791 [Dreissena polymorpha]
MLTDEEITDFVEGQKAKHTETTRDVPAGSTFVPTGSSIVGQGSEWVTTSSVV